MCFSHVAWKILVSFVCLSQFFCENNFVCLIWRRLHFVWTKVLTAVFGLTCGDRSFLESTLFVGLPLFWFVFGLRSLEGEKLLERWSFLSLCCFWSRWSFELTEFRNLESSFTFSQIFPVWKFQSKTMPIWLKAFGSWLKAQDRRWMVTRYKKGRRSIVDVGVERSWSELGSYVPTRLVEKKVKVN